MDARYTIRRAQLLEECQTDLPPCFEQTIPHNSLALLALWDRERTEASAYILRKLLAGGNGVPKASRIAF